MAHRADPVHGDPLLPGLAIHALLDRGFAARRTIWLAAGANGPLRRVDLSAVDTDTHTLDDLDQFRTAVTGPPSPPTPAGHLVVTATELDELIELLRPATILQCDPATGALTLHIADQLDLDDSDLAATIALLWPALAGADIRTPIQHLVATVAHSPAADVPSSTPPPLFVTRFAAVARAHPDRIAVETPTRTITYAELEATANAIAAALAGYGLRHGDVLLLIPRRDEQLVATVVAALKLGVALAIANPQGPPAYLRECARAAQATRIVDLAGVGLPDALRHLPTGPDPDAQAGNHFQDERLAPDDCAVVTFTSGTSGTPRAVRGRYSSLTHFFDWMDRHLGPLHDARFGMCSMLGHDPLQRDIMTPLYLGATIVIPESEEVVSRSFTQWLAETEVQVICVNPSAITLLAAQARPLPRLRTVFLVGSVLTRAHATALAAVAPAARIVNLYGSTETQRAVAYFEIDTAETPSLPQIVPVGAGMADVELLVLTPRARPCVPWQTGQLAVRSTEIALGYVGDPAATAEKFRTGLPAGTAAGDTTPTYLTGDLGYRTLRHGAHYLGRADNQVDINGYRVELEHITARCLAMPAVRDAATITFELEGAPALAAFVVPQTPAIRFEPRAFRAALAEQLPAHMVPHRVVTIAELPMTRNRKVDTGMLATYLDDRAAATLSGRLGAEAGGPARMVRDYLRHLTGLDDPDLSAPLASLGMDSLRFTALLARLPVTNRAQASTALSAAELLAGLDGATPPIPHTTPAPSTAPADEPLDLRALLGPISRVDETTIEAAGRRWDHLCSNSYLGLSSDPRLRAGLLEFVSTAPSLGSHGSPEINGFTAAHDRLTRGLSTLLGGSITLYSSAYLANISVIPAIAGPGDQLFYDERSHRSVRDGLLLSGADLHPYRHNDPSDLDDQMRRLPVTGRRVIVSEALFGVDGDIADLPGLVAVARDRQAILCLDEASSIGQLAAGRGLEAHYGMAGQVDLRIGSLGKALAAGGGFVACSDELTTLLRRHRGATFSTALSPLAAQLAAAAVDILLAEGEELTARLHANRTVWAETLRDRGIDTGLSTTAIVPVYPPGPGDTARWFHAALDADIFTLPLAASWTPRPGGGLRTTVTAAHDPGALAEIADRLARSLTRAATRQESLR